MLETKQIGAPASFLEALKICYRKRNLVISFLLFVLIPINLLAKFADRCIPPLVVVNLYPKQLNPELHDMPLNVRDFDLKVNLISWVLSWISELSMAYLSAMICSREKMTLRKLLQRARRTWRRPAITLFCMKLFNVANLSPMAVLHILTRNPGWMERMASLPGWRLMTIILVVFSTIFATLTTFSFVDMVGKWMLVSSVAEDETFGFGGVRGVKFMRGRKARVFALMVLLCPLEITVSKIGGFDRGGEWSHTTWVTPLYLIGSTYVSFVLTVFYCYNTEKSE